MIVYALTDGLAHDLRYEKADYVLQPNERSLSGWGALPPLESLHDPARVQAEKDALETERLRLQSLSEDALAVELLQRLRAATPAEIAGYVNNNVTDIASARAMFKRILLVMALISG